MKHARRKKQPSKNIAKRKRAHAKPQLALQNKLVKNHIFLRMILENSPAPIYVKDTYGKYVLVNLAFERFCGITREQTIGKTDSELFQKDFVKLFTLGDAAAIQQQKSTQVEQNIAVLDESRTYLCSKFPILKDNGHVEAICGKMYDITEAKRLQAQMTQNMKMSSFGEMSAGIAHEINNPLAIIIGKSQQTIQLLRKGNPDNQKILGNIETVSKTADRIARVINGLRSLSRNADGDPIEATSIKSLVDDTTIMCESRFRANGVDLQIIDHTNNFNLECRAIPITQLLISLLNNAQDAISQLQEKWVKLQIYDDDNSVRFEVSDSGPGIPLDVQDRLFEPFFSTKPVGEGTGLGLSVATSIVKAHHGRIYIDNMNPNTCFVVCIPKKQPDFFKKAA